MLPRAVLLCVLLLQAQGGPRERVTEIEEEDDHQNIKHCSKQPAMYLCKRPCESHVECRGNEKCCLSYCGMICQSFGL
ncbi:WAP four-disulfide core domain protein 10A [Ochotona curzoniae]|uniref:WAP four-disulfide core domain protein 10A n=1 Tax=Ochotona curzoniae TaxID=130825 RepID=UPI001B352683|nr:WAP four-disulfide core domain protein 10A [Ochotona curzoniae]